MDERGDRGRLLLIDLSADFRADDRFVYGLPEWNRDRDQGRETDRECRAVLRPRCSWRLLPLRGLDVGFIAATAVTGSSGSGASASATTHHPTRANDFRAYKILSASASGGSDRRDVGVRDQRPSVVRAAKRTIR